MVARSFQGVQGTIGQPTAHVIDGSLRFNGTSHYLSRGFSSGNRRTFTLSCWVKAYHGSDQNDAHHSIFSVGSSKDNIFNFAFRQTATADGHLFTFERTTGGGEVTHINTATSGALRDSSAWYHFVLQFDTTQSASADRIRMYINGELKSTGSGTIPSQNYQSAYVNTNTTHQIGRFIDNSQWYGDYSLAQYYFIDGQALGPGYFGFTDPLTNTWRPKKFRAKGTTINDGTVWSSLASVSSGSFQGSYPATYGFNGTLTSSNRANGDTNGSSIDLDFSSKNIIVKNDIAIWSGKSSIRYSINGGDYVYYEDATEKWKTILFSGKLTSLKIKHGSDSEQPGFSGLAVDGVTMLDSTTTNLDFGTNGFYLPMDNQDNFEKDKSGKGNHFTKNNFGGTSIDPDVLKDSPSGAVFGGRGQTGITTTSSAPANYAVLNPLNMHTTNNSLSEGNLKFTTSGNDGGLQESTLEMSSGKFYFEVVYSASGTGQFAGIRKPGARNYNDSYIYVGTGQKYIDGGSGTSYGNTLAHGDIIGTAFDATNGTLEFFKNGVSQGVAYTGISGTYCFFVGSFGAAPTGVTNFGQKPFKYAPPQGYLPLNSATARPNKVIPRPDQYVGVTTYKGESSSFRLRSGFSPDLVFIKSRTNTTTTVVFDTVRGLANYFQLSETDQSYSGGLTQTFNDGFLVPSPGGAANNASHTYVTWTWKAGGNKNTFNVDDVGYANASAAGLGASGNSWDSDPTGASIGTEQGFSIIKHSGTGSTGTLPHGLTQKPTFYISKPVSTSGNWVVYTDLIDGSLDYFYLNTSAGKGDSSQSVPTSELFYYGYTANEYIHYLWHDVPGLQKFGKYTGNLSTDGPYIGLGFRPAVILCKSVTNGNNWFIKDNKRSSSGSNPINQRLYPNATNAEMQQTTYHEVDFLSNGFKLRGNGSEDNANNDTIIYAAWAEVPAFSLFGGQSNAR